jgi:hypothetical protein
VSVLVHGAAKFRADDLALVIRQPDGRLDLQFGHELAMQDGAFGAHTVS